MAKQEDIQGWEFWKSKTFWTAIIGLVFTGYKLYTGEIDANSAMAIAVPAFSAIFLRHGIEKNA